MLRKLDDKDEDGDRLIKILVHMVEFRVSRRWAAKKCLMQGLDTGLFNRRKVDGLIICAKNQEDLEAGTKTPTPPSPSVRASLPQPGIDPDATIILENMWSGGELSSSR